MLEEQLNAFCEQNQIYRFEGPDGVESLATIMRTLGYDSKYYKSNEDVIADFLADNSGACEALVNWIGEQSVPEWKAKLEEVVEDEDEDDIDSCPGCFSPDCNGECAEES